MATLKKTTITLWVLHEHSIDHNALAVFVTEASQGDCAWKFRVVGTEDVPPQDLDATLRCFGVSPSFFQRRAKA